VATASECIKYSLATAPEFIQHPLATTVLQIVSNTLCNPFAIPTTKLWKGRTVLSEFYYECPVQKNYDPFSSQLLRLFKRYLLFGILIVVWIEKTKKAEQMHAFKNVFS
jgi:hypothetical protein